MTVLFLCCVQSATFIVRNRYRHLSVGANDYLTKLRQAQNLSGVKWEEKIIMKDEMEIKILKPLDLFQNDGIHLDWLRKTMKEFSLCIQLPSWELKPGIFQLHFENFTGRAKKPLYGSYKFANATIHELHKTKHIYRYCRKLTSGYCTC